MLIIKKLMIASR